MQIKQPNRQHLSDSRKVVIGMPMLLYWPLTNSMPTIFHDTTSQQQVPFKSETERQKWEMGMQNAGHKPLTTLATRKSVVFIPVWNISSIQMDTGTVDYPPGGI